MTAETVKVRVQDLLDAQAAASAIEQTTANYREVRAVVATLDRIVREAHELGEPEPTVAGGDL